MRYSEFDGCPYVFIRIYCPTYTSVQDIVEGHPNLLSDLKKQGKLELVLKLFSKRKGEILQTDAQDYFERLKKNVGDWNATKKETF